ncbi:MAG: putative Histidine kinase [Gemmatimonadetes bacterium]|nr:putative Histidine kinase [Gemmatimonadota bacterium]
MVQRMIPVSQGARLLHLAGFGTGIILYAMLGMMVVRAARVPGGRRDHIPLATAVLGLLWNVGALALYGLRDLGLAPASSATPILIVLGTIALCALAFLPAVVVHAAMLGTDPRLRRGLTGIAYALSFVAASLQVWGAFTEQTEPTRTALQLLTAGYAVVLPVLAFVLRKQPGNRGPLTAAALAAFAVMALHLSHHVAGPEDVGSELWGHHASLLLAVVILYQDFRFALADLFLKRVLAAILLAAAGMLAHVYVVVPLVLPRLSADPADPLATTVLLALWGVAVVTAWWLRRVVWLFVDRVVLHRPDYRALREQMARDVAQRDDVEAVLDAIRAQLATALGASMVTWRATSDAEPSEAAALPVVTLVYHGSEALVAIPTVELPHFVIAIEGLAPGRRLLSDDVALLEHASNAAARRIDAIRVAHERYDREARERDIMRLATEAELRALRAQLNPHFLFNALTTIGYLVQTAPERALVTLHRLTDLLRAVLRPSANELVPLADEIEIISAYLAIEHARFEERLRVTIDVSDDARAALLPPLLLQPLVENAVKHGIGPLRAGGDVIVRARIERIDASADGERKLHLSVTDTGAGADPAQFTRQQQDGVGVSNVERRLASHYGPAATMSIRTSPGMGTGIELWLPLSSAAGAHGGSARDTDGDDEVPPMRAPVIHERSVAS